MNEQTFLSILRHVNNTLKQAVRLYLQGQSVLYCDQILMRAPLHYATAMETRLY